jgi:hypothetical protein
MTNISVAAFAFLLLGSLPATAIETPAAQVYRAIIAIIDECLERYLSNKDLNAAQLETGRPLIVQCDCIARFLFSFMDDEARIREKVASNWNIALLRCTSVILR